MFTILASSPLDMLDAMFILSHYQVKFQAFSDAEDPLSTEIVVDEEGREGDLRMAEMAFQMNFRQVGKICPSCKREDPEETICGHLTFKGQLPNDPFEEVGKIQEAGAFTLVNMSSIPAGSNPFHHDLTRMGTPINKRFMAMYDGGNKNSIVLVDMKLGKRALIVVPQVEVEEED
jgi:hypothetical protein